MSCAVSAFSPIGPPDNAIVNLRFGAAPYAANGIDIAAPINIRLEILFRIANLPVKEKPDTGRYKPATSIQQPETIQQSPTAPSFSTVPE